MLKQLTLSVLAAALLPACILTPGETTTSESNSNTESATGTTGTTSSATDVGTGTTSTTGSATDGGTGTTDVPTTDAPTTDATTSTTEATTSTATDSTTGSSAYGQCGWVADQNYYACAPDGTPGAEDPAAIDLIPCAANLAEGDKCDDDNGPVTSIGCCTPEGDNWYCDVITDPENPVIIKEACGV